LRKEDWPRGAEVPHVLAAGNNDLLKGFS